MHRELNDKGPVALIALIFAVVVLWGVFALGRPAAAEEYQAPESLRMEAALSHADVSFKTSDFPDVTAVYDRDLYNVEIHQEGDLWKVSASSKNSDEEKAEPVTIYLPDTFWESITVDADGGCLNMADLPSGNILVRTWRSQINATLSETFQGSFTGELRSSDMIFHSEGGYDNSRTSVKRAASEEVCTVIVPSFFTQSEEEKGLYTYEEGDPERVVSILMKETGILEIK